MLYHTETRNAFCKEWKEMNGESGEELYTWQKNRILRRKKIIGPSGPTGTSYTAYLVSLSQLFRIPSLTVIRYLPNFEIIQFGNKLDKMYKLVDRSLYGARAPFIKIFGKEEKLDGMSEEELARKSDSGMMGMDNATDCNCFAFETQSSCEGSVLGCIWRSKFESCHPPEKLDDASPICPETSSPTISPTQSGYLMETESPTLAPSHAPATNTTGDPLIASYFRIREHEEAGDRLLQLGKDEDDDLKD